MAAKRTLHLDKCPNGLHILRLTVGAQATRYFCERIDNGRDFAVEVKLEKFAADGGERYTVTVGKVSTCGCRGFARWGARGACKHVAAVKLLVERGDLQPVE